MQKRGAFPALSLLINDIPAQVRTYSAIDKAPLEQVGNTRNDMYPRRLRLTEPDYIRAVTCKRQNFQPTALSRQRPT